MRKVEVKGSWYHWRGNRWVRGGLKLSLNLCQRPILFYHLSRGDISLSRPKGGNPGFKGLRMGSTEWTVLLCTFCPGNGRGGVKVHPPWPYVPRDRALSGSFSERGIITEGTQGGKSGEIGGISGNGQVVVWENCIEAELPLWFVEIRVLGESWGKVSVEIGRDSRRCREESFSWKTEELTQELQY